MMVNRAAKETPYSLEMRILFDVFGTRTLEFAIIALLLLAATISFSFEQHIYAVGITDLRPHLNLTNTAPPKSTITANARGPAVPGGNTTNPGNNTLPISPITRERNPASPNAPISVGNTPNPSTNTGPPTGQNQRHWYHYWYHGHWYRKY